jgi:hypothetical protein
MSGSRLDDLGHGRELHRPDREFHRVFADRRRAMALSENRVRK